MVRNRLGSHSFEEISRDNVQLAIYSDPYNRRIRVDEFDGEIDQVYRTVMDELPNWTEKLIIKSRIEHMMYFLNWGFVLEGCVRAYFNGDDMVFMVKYLKGSRAETSHHASEQLIIDTVLNSIRESKTISYDEIRIADQSKAKMLAQLYADVFKFYPTPLKDPDYLEKTIKEGTIYVYLEENGKVLSAASAEINHNFINVELTDCATCPEDQGKGYMAKLLSKLETILLEKGIFCLYTIARAQSFGINKVFYSLGYSYGGRLINNCYIFSGLEDMNVWYKVTGHPSITSN